MHNMMSHLRSYDAHKAVITYFSFRITTSFQEKASINDARLCQLIDI